MDPTFMPAPHQEEKQEGLELTGMEKGKPRDEKRGAGGRGGGDWRSMLGTELWS